jgi:peroxiredoxin
MKKRYNLIVREYNKMDISKIEEYTIQVETDDIDFTIEQYCRNRHVENLTAELILEDDDYGGPNKSYGV